ncbi:hypothetical protein D3C78_1815190 [compost metagenome]
MQLFGAAQAEGLELVAPVKGMGGFEQQFGRHAAHARAGRAPGGLVDQRKALRVAAHGTQGGQPRGAGPDDEHVVIVVMVLVHAGYCACEGRFWL